MSNSANTISSITREVISFPGVSYLDDVQLSDGLLSGSITNAAVVACSDMGWLVPYVCSSTNVQLYLFQSFGHRFSSGGLVDTIVNSKVENVVIYGHSVCEYTRFIARSVYDKSSETSIKSSVCEQQLDLYSAALSSDSEALWEKVGQYNVLNEIKELLSDPVIAPIASRGNLSVHGWFYRSASRQLAVLDPAQEAFVVPRSKILDFKIMKFVPDEFVGEDLPTKRSGDR